MKKNRDTVKKGLTLTDNMKIVSASPELMNFTKIAYGLFKDIDAKAFIRFKTSIDGEDFEIEFKKVIYTHL